jgi:hypothetical protein
MPTNSKVDRCFQAVKKEGKPEGSAAAICQASTHQVLSTGKPIRKKLLCKRLKCSKIMRGRCSCEGCGG